jgi:hypothetical protein
MINEQTFSKVLAIFYAVGKRNIPLQEKYILAIAICDGYIIATVGTARAKK